MHRRKEVSEENHGSENERRLFHGSAFINAIVHKGFDERHAYIGGMFGAGLYPFLYQLFFYVSFIFHLCFISSSLYITCPYV